MWQEFKEFLNRGSVVDLAVAVILGLAFGAIVTSLVNDIIMPLIGIIIGGIDFASLSLMVGSAQLNYGLFIQAIINFLLVAFVLFLVVKAYNRMRRTTPPAPAAPTEDIVLLREIRDLLRRDARIP